MSTLLNFEFLAILNLFILMLWPVSGAYRPVSTDNSNVVARRGWDVISIIVLILTVLAVVLDIFFLVLKLAH